jgi:hypothetical protein
LAADVVVLRGNHVHDGGAGLSCEGAGCAGESAFVIEDGNNLFERNIYCIPCRTAPEPGSSKTAA